MSSLVTKRIDHAVCSRAAEVGLVLEPGQLRRRIENSRRTRQDTYWQLGRYAFDVFNKQPRPVLSNRVERAGLAGFDVAARLLSFAPDAYRDYCQQDGIAPSLGQIRDSLKRSGETPKQFQALPDPGQTVEQAFGLLDYGSGFDSPDFRFEETGEGLLYVADEDKFSKRAEKLEYSGDLPKQWQGCLAIKLVGQQCWPAMVDLAVDTPEAFAHDLGMVEASFRKPPTRAGQLSVFLCAE